MTHDKDKAQRTPKVKSTETKMEQEEQTVIESEVATPAEEVETPPTSPIEEMTEQQQLLHELQAYKEAGMQVAAAYEALHKKHTEQEEQLSRIQSEYDNFRRRSKDELEGKYAEACADVLGKVLPVADNLLRAIAHADPAEQGGGLYQGLNMTLSQFDAAFTALGVEEIEYETFDPSLHHAVAHIEDESYGAGQIVEVLQKGYKKGDRVIRYAMVKVAN